ncbi:uncharacterized protein LOC132704683 [Cylas formicarius]|uniref:uncharacterized protein LOC132704683 n=1 Tax=Cylas formicarius TaxID=197179 RepID=UPI002958B24F|nr:uncharacterized protein LOC132704683 [Cylas formicarius]
MKSSIDCEAIETRDAEDREEGEIVDDDLEDISDNSIISTTPCNGKSLSSTDRLPAISLSSVTEESSLQPRRRRKRCAHRKDSKHSRKKRRIRKKSSDSEDEEAIDKSLQFQLKAAVCVDAKISRRNSLQTRLKAMTKSTETADEKIENINLVSSEAEEPNDEDAEIDNELMQLRLEALQTAIYNKYKDKKRKNNGDNSDETNKENSGGNGAEAVKQPENTPPSPDEDEDILRALLLASMSKKITNKIDVVSEKTAPKLYAAPNYKLNHLKSKPMMAPKFPQVRPLIIDLNDDSDTEDDLVSDKIETVDKVIENTVEKFLKEQREKVETENNDKALVKVLNPPKKAVTNVYASSRMMAPRRTSLKVVNRKFVTPPKPKKTALFNKSTLNLLPEDKRREYEKLQLLLTLKKAERRPRVRRLSQRVSESGAKNKPARPKVDQTSGFPKTGTSTKEDVKKSNPLQLLQGALKEMQYRKNGSLQIHARYGGLRPLIKKIDQLGKEEKQWNQQIKRLLEELAEARKKQQAAQANMSNAIKRLVQWKGKIDRSAKAPATSTPVKKDLPPPPQLVILPTKPPSNKERREHSSPTTDIEINSGDPNDIDRIISKAKLPPVAHVSEKIKYVSPLDPVKRSELSDPFSIMCPFEVDGTCKDPDCTYQHFIPK